MIFVDDIKKIRDVLKEYYDVLCDGMCQQCDFLENEETCKLESAYDTIDELLEVLKGYPLLTSKTSGMFLRYSITPYVTIHVMGVTSLMITIKNVI